MDNIPGMVFQCINDPPSFPFTFVSKGCEALTGYASDDFLGNNAIKFLDMVHPDDAQTIENLIETTLLVGAPFETTFRVATKDGTGKRAWIRSRVTETDSDGLPFLFEGFCTDITKQLRIDAAMLANRAKSEFLTRMSHDIRTPMNSVIGMAELGLREEMPENVREYIYAIKHAGSNLMSALSNIMDFAQIESGEMLINEEDYSLSLLLNEVINDFTMQLNGTAIEFIVDIDKDIPDELTGDFARLKQILSNLLSNAVKFTNVGSVSLSIGADIVGNVLNLVIEVEDTGRGIKQEDISKLFREYAQFDSKTIEGTGLGLAITYNLLKLMGGEINISSMYEVGSVFTVTLPQQIRSFEKINLDFSPSYKQYEKFTAPDARILIVDDISTNLKVAEGLLSPYKMTLDFCESGADAIVAVKLESYDLILMDYLMPVMSGLDTAIHIRGLDESASTNCSDVPIVALTANAIPGVRAMFLKNGFNDFLAKPIDIAMLNDIIKRWIPREKHIKVLEGQVDDEPIRGSDIMIAGIEVDQGITMTGGRLDNYLGILRTYYENGCKKLDELEDCINRGDMELYRVYVHALKGVSGNIGAFKMSQAAEALELAVERGDLAFIQSNHSAFLAELKTLLDNIHPVIAEDVDTQAIDMEVFKSDLAQLKTAMNDYNLASINVYANNLQKYLLSADVGNVVNEIMQYKMTGEYDEAVALIDTILN